MDYVKLGTSGVTVSRIILGCGNFGGIGSSPAFFGQGESDAEAARIMDAAFDLGIPYLTLYSFSSENWSRPAEEIADLMGLMKRFIRRDLAELHQAGVCIVVIGERTNVDPELMALIDEGCELTRGNRPGGFRVFFAQSGAPKRR